ncbi:MAG: hypothetical protein JNL69_07525, partial [Bacteroidia bacterium]|nr:hypothetical protein [Bacteroidia bacterium]
MKTKRIVLVLYFFIASFCHLMAGGTADTVRLESSTSPKKASLIQSMTKEQLNLLVEFLLELDTIPPDLHSEIQMAYARFNTEKMDSKT